MYTIAIDLETCERLLRQAQNVVLLVVVKPEIEC